MHIRKISRVKPQMAFNIELILDIILQFLNVLSQLENVLGISLPNLGKDDGTAT